MNLVFCGTPLFAVPSLKKLVQAGFNVSLVVTQPDKPRGRGLELSHSPVKKAALELELPVAQPDKIKDNEKFQAQLASMRPEAIIVVGYGRIIPRWMIDLPPLGNLNLHASLLPKYRGAAPIQWAIALGEKITGVTIMRIDEGLDTGDILMQAEILIANEDTSESLAPRLAQMGAELMVDTLHALKTGAVVAQPQDHSKATLAPILTKEDGLIAFSRTAFDIWNRLRGFQPWPGAYTSFRGKQLRIHAAKPHESSMHLGPGEIVADHRQLIVGCGDNTALAIFELQLEGKKRMEAREFLNGYKPLPGEQLGNS